MAAVGRTVACISSAITPGIQNRDARGSKIGLIAGDDCQAVVDGGRGNEPVDGRKPILQAGR